MILLIAWLKLNGFNTFLSPQVGSFPVCGLYPRGLAKLCFKLKACLRAEPGVARFTDLLIQYTYNFKIFKINSSELVKVDF